MFASKSWCETPKTRGYLCRNLRQSVSGLLEGSHARVDVAFMCQA